MLYMTKAYALPDVDFIILNFFFKSATLELIEVLPAKEKTLLNRSWHKANEFHHPVLWKLKKYIIELHDVSSSNFCRKQK